MTMRTNRRHGLTMLEMLIAITLFWLMAISVYSGIILTGRITSGNAQQARATDFAEELFEHLLSANFDDVVYSGTISTTSDLVTAMLPSGELPSDDQFQAFAGVGELGLNAQWALSITNPDTSHRLVELIIRWNDTVTGRQREKQFRLYRYDDEFVRYPYRAPAS